MQDMVISGVYALAYFCLAIPMALFSEEWKNHGDDVNKIRISL